MSIVKLMDRKLPKSKNVFIPRDERLDGDLPYPDELARLIRDSLYELDKNLNENIELKEEISDLEYSIREWRDIVEQRDSEIETLKEELNDKDNEISDLEYDLHVAGETEETMKQKIDELSQEIVDLQGDLSYYTGP